MNNLEKTFKKRKPLVIRIYLLIAYFADLLPLSSCCSRFLSKKKSPKNSQKILKKSKNEDEKDKKYR